MTNVSFYRLPDSMGSLFPLLVSLTEKSLDEELDLLILAESREQALPIHGYLEQRFQLGGEMMATPTPAARFSLCWEEDPGHHHGMLINLTDSLPTWFSRFDYLVELIRGDDEQVRRKRENYRLCRHRGYPLQYHDLMTEQRQSALI